ncbi:hypothetical protein OAE21_01155 [Rubripirellula sp.]|nr:hypothetical protein [Rubripirellula sp.]
MDRPWYAFHESLAASSTLLDSLNGVAVTAGFGCILAHWDASSDWQW